MKLIDAKPGDVVQIEEFLAPFCDIQTRVCSMGVNKSEFVRVLVNSFFNPILLDANGSRVAVSRVEAKKIKVKLIRREK